MADTTWKAAERRIAAKLRGVRTPLSGRNGGTGTNGDYTAAHPHNRTWLYGEFKHYARAAIFTLFRDSKEKAKREHRQHTIVVMHEKASSLYVAVVELDFLAYLIDKAEENGTSLEY